MKLTRCFLIRTNVCAYYDKIGKTIVIKCDTVASAEEAMYYILKNKLTYTECLQYKEKLNE